MPWDNEDTYQSLLDLLISSRIVNTVAMENNRTSCCITNRADHKEVNLRVLTQFTYSTNNHLQPVMLPNWTGLKQMTLGWKVLSSQHFWSPSFPCFLNPFLNILQCVYFYGYKAILRFARIFTTILQSILTDVSSNQFWRNFPAKGIAS